MTCDRVRDQLEDYHGDRLNRTEWAAVAEHLEGCGECREDLEALRFVARRVAGLPRTIVPARELWGGIERRIGWGRRAMLIAATVVLLLLPAILLLGRGDRTALDGAAGADVAALVEQYRSAAAELAGELAPSAVSPAAAPLVARQLETLDAAIGESEAAFRNDPADPAVQALLLSAHRKKLYLLRQATHLAGEG